MIGICAQSRMGKDTVADYMLTHSELKKWKKKSFANELKNLVSQYFQISLDEIEEYKSSQTIHPKLNMKMRDTLQIIGETFRSISPDVWVNAAMIDKETNLIFTDVRHENEMDAILKKKGILILLGRTKYLNTDPHPSESGLKDAVSWFLQNTKTSIVKVSDVKNVPVDYQRFSYFIRNDSTLKDLYNDINVVIKFIKI